MRAVAELQRRLQQREVRGVASPGGRAAGPEADRLAEAIAARLREVVSPAEGCVPATTPPEAQALSDPDQRALQEAHAILDAALAIGRWTAEDAKRLQELMRSTGKGMAQRQAWAEVMARIVQGINRLELVPDEPGNAFP
jgi:hypothetical protein